MIDLGKITFIKKSVSSDAFLTSTASLFESVVRHAIDRAATLRVTSENSSSRFCFFSSLFAKTRSKNMNEILSNVTRATGRVALKNTSVDAGFLKRVDFVFIHEENNFVKKFKIF